jgi:carbamoyltransferase
MLRSGALVVGLNGWERHSHNAAVSLIEAEPGDLRIAFALEEERISRRKSALDTLPTRALEAMFLHYGLSPEDVGHYVFGWRRPADWSRAREDDLSEKLFGRPGILAGRLAFIDHHQAHAACTYRTSPFERALVIVLDGAGDDESGSVWIGEPAGLRRVATIGIESSLGFLFEAANLTLGFGNLDSGKTMGLAAFGQPTYYDDLMACFSEGPLLSLNASVIGVHLSLARRKVAADQSEPHDHHAIVLMWLLYFQDRLRIARPTADRPRSFPEIPQARRDLAASVQAVVQDLGVRLVQMMIDAHGVTDVCISGGVGLNCMMNGHILARTKATGLFVNPAANDAGAAMGAALEVGWARSGAPRAAGFSPHLGLEVPTGAIAEALRRRGMDFESVDCAADRLCRAIVDRGQVVGLFQGREEWGPRALGARSIVSVPRDPDRRDYINRQVKGRELGRPLAPSLLAADLNGIAAAPPRGACLDFMNVAISSKPEARATMPAVIHVDGSFRPQLVRTATNPLYARQLETLRAYCGTSVVLNTSFNIDDTPIVHTPDNAIDAFLGSAIDVMVFNNELIVRKPTA